MKECEIIVRDLYEGAYLLCRGFRIKHLTVIGSNGKKIVTFTFTGNRVKEISEEYQAGKATVNVSLLKFTMEKLKDRMFEKIREQDRGERKNAHTTRRDRSYQEAV